MNIGWIGGAVPIQSGYNREPHHRLDRVRTEYDGIVGLYAVEGGVVGAVSDAVLGVVGEGSRGLAGGEGDCYEE